MIVGLDTSGAELAVCLLKPADEAGLVPLRAWPGGWGRGLSVVVSRQQGAIFDALGELLGGDFDSASLTAIGVVRGPGSYSGLRSGLAAAAGLAFPRRLPIPPVSSLAVAAHRAAPAQGSLLTLVDAGRGRAYAQEFKFAPAQRVPSGSVIKIEVAQLGSVFGGDRALAGEASVVAAAETVGAGQAAPGYPAHEALAAALAEAVGAGEVVGYDGLRADYGE